MRIFGSEKLDSVLGKLGMDEGEAIIHPWVNKAQEKVESQYYDTRKRLSDYDEIVNIQRKAIFNERKLILGFRSVRAELIFYGEDLIINLSFF